MESERRSDGRRGKKRERGGRSVPPRQRRCRSAKRNRHRGAKVSKTETEHKQHDPKLNKDDNSSQKSKSGDDAATSGPSLTDNAVESMILCSDTLRFTDISPSASISSETDHGLSQTNEHPTIVRLYFDEPTNDDGDTSLELHHPEDLPAARVLMSDGKCSMPVVVLNTDSNLPLLLSHRLDGFNDFVVSVHGYVVTDNYASYFKAFKGKIPPYLCLSSVTILTSEKLSKVPIDLGRTWLEAMSDSLPRILAAAIPANDKPSNKSENNDGVSTSSPSKQPANMKIMPRVQGGDAGSLLLQWAPFLTNDALAGGSAVLNSDTTSDLDDYEDQVSRVANFLAQHTAMMTLQSTAAVSTSNSGRNTPVSSTVASTSMTGDKDAVDANPTEVANASGPSANATETVIAKPGCVPTSNTVYNYNAALKEFSASQFDRQRASLVSNSGRETADRAEMVIEQFRETLECSLGNDEASSLTIPLLCGWHSKLLKGLHADAGKIRSRTVRAGHTFFTPPSKIQSELEALCKCLESLQVRLSVPRSAPSSSRSASSSTRGDKQSKDEAVQALTYVAAAMFGCVDAHPFSDGNGRLCRIVANWALKRVANVPFPINLFATPAQRADFMTAIQQTRCNFSLRAQGGASRDEILKAFQGTGAFLPLVRLLMDRLARAVDECLRVWEEKSGLAAEQDEARIARRAREKAAEGTCLICFEEKPNIATLCCGKAVHLNCIAEWLGGNNSCPACRTEMPKITGKVVRAAADAGLEIRRMTDTEFDDDDEDTSDTIEDDDEGSTTGSTSSTSSSDDHIRTLAAQIQRRIGQQQGVDLGDRLGFQIARRLFRSMTRDRHLNQETSETTEEDDENGTTSSTTGEEDEDGTAEDETNQGGDNSAEAIAGHEGDTTEVGDTTNDVEESTETTGDDTTEPSTPAPAQASSSGRYCGASHCRNRPAIDCTNMLCGRCCVLTGTFFCQRHNS